MAKKHLELLRGCDLILVLHSLAPTLLCDLNLKTEIYQGLHIVNLSLTQLSPSLKLVYITIVDVPSTSHLCTGN